MLTEQLDKALKELIEQWNVAEHRIKTAEAVRGGVIVSSAIFELRYAGRKLIDSIQLALSHDLAADQATHGKACAWIGDATEDCVKAKHDAIDAMMNFVTGWFDETERLIQMDRLTQFFPDYLPVTAKIIGIQERIAESRQDRTKLRDGIYNEIEKDGYPEILQLFNTMRVSKDRLLEIVAREQQAREQLARDQAEALAAKAKFERWSIWAAVGGVGVGVVGIAVSLAIAKGWI